MVRGCSRGFGVLLIGGLVQPLVGLTWAPLAYVWLPLVAAAAFVVAGVTATPRGGEPEAWRQAPMAALWSYLLILPLVLVAAHGVPLLQVLLTVLTALAVGTLTGMVRTRRPSPGHRSVRT